MTQVGPRVIEGHRFTWPHEIISTWTKYDMDNQWYGRLFRGDFQMARELARQRFEEGGKCESISNRYIESNWNERERAILYDILLPVA